MKYAINASGSKFGYNDLRFVIEQNLAFLERFSSLRFDPIQETDDPPEAATYYRRIISFVESFPSANKHSYATSNFHQIAFNTSAMNFMTTEQIRAVTLHEMFHHLQLHHDTERYSIMTGYRFRNIATTSLLWRHDLIELQMKYPLGMTPIGWCSADKDLRIMIPAIMYQDQQWSLRMRHVYGETFVMEKDYVANDGVDMELKAHLMPDEELWIYDLSFLGFNYPLLKFKITQRNITLIRD